MAGIYVHFPFCASFCLYCGFYSRTASGKAGEYVEALLREIDARKGFFRKDVVPRTLYFGGGTPSLMPVEDLSRIACALRRTFGVVEFDEFTLEANPDDVTAGRLSSWISSGVGRLSLGVQSFDDRHLHWMRRRHTAADAVRAVEKAREAGFGNISIDLIFGYEGLSLPVWRATLEQAVALRPDHISCYQMMVDGGSALCNLSRRGEYREPPQEECAAQYALAQEILRDAGYLQYEISNFALPSRESQHNGSYWDRSPYAGFGAAAHSFDGESRRFWNAADLDRYLAAAASGSFESISSGETLSDKDIANEIVMLGLRRTCGFDPSLLPEAWRERIETRACAMAEDGLLERCGWLWRIPSGKLFVSDDIISDLFV